MKISAALSTTLWLLCGAPGFSQDCSEYEFRVPLSDELTLDYVLTLDDDVEGQGILNARLTLDRETWLGFGVSQTGMVPSTAIIGIPGTGEPLKYSMTEKNINFITPLSEDRQTLQDANIVQVNGQTIMTFRKPLVEVDELAIDPDGENAFIFAYGTDGNNVFGRHRFEDRGVARFLLTPCLPEGVTASPTVAELPSASPTSFPTSSDLDCNDFQQFRQLSPELFFEYVVNSDGPDDILHGRLVLEREAWLAVGFSESAVGGMVPADVVIGRPDLGLSESNPGKYFLGGKDINLVNLRESQTLFDTNLVQQNGQTIMTFSRILNEPGEVEVFVNALNTMIWAYGTNNNFGQHAGTDRGAVRITIPSCVPGVAPVVGEEEVLLGSRSYRDFYTAHGIFAAVAWGFLSPLAIASSMLRPFFPKGGLWFKAHFYLNMTVFVFTVIAFILAVTARSKSTLEGESPNHFVHAIHGIVGLVIMIITLLQVMGGLARPHAPHKLADGTMEPREPKRLAFEILHKGAGFGLLFTAWWQCLTGIQRYLILYPGTDYTRLFLGVVGTIGVTTFFMWIHYHCNTISKFISGKK